MHSDWLILFSLTTLRRSVVSVLNLTSSYMFSLFLSTKQADLRHIKTDDGNDGVQELT